MSLYPTGETVSAVFPCGSSNINVLGMEDKMKINKIIFATGNQNKLKEIKNIMSDISCEIRSLKDEGIEADIDENGKTFEENAIIKARAICDMTGEVALADDSGLEVDYMDKKPGVYSARFMGEDTPYSIKNAAIIKNLENAHGDERSARFVCVIAAAFPDGRLLTARGTIEGVIAYEEKGENGFGYDPIFYVPEYGMTTAQMEPEVKNSISHRGKALQIMKEKLRNEGIDC